MPQHWMALPRWARETLEDHEQDHRENRYHWHALRWAQTDDELWNLCQHSLNVHGELHNNLRMTWGKQIIQWTTPRKALLMVLDLNNRFALDGRDPSSYGGILWCFGLFDRPFTPSKRFEEPFDPEQPIHIVSDSILNNIETWSNALHTAIDIQVHTPALVACLINQAIEPYDCTMTSISEVDGLKMPKHFSTNHQTKLLLGSWIEAGWLIKQDDVYVWSTSGLARFTEQWESIPKDKIVSDAEGSFIQIQDNRFHLSEQCVVMQYQEAMHFISMELKKLVTKNQATQLQLYYLTWTDCP